MFGYPPFVRVRMTQLCSIHCDRMKQALNCLESDENKVLTFQRPVSACTFELDRVPDYV